MWGWLPFPLRASPGSARYLVEESEDRPDLVVLVGDGHVEANDERLGAFRAKAPAETRLLVVRVDRSGQAEHQAGELLLDRADSRVDLATAARLCQWVGVFGVHGQR